MKLLKCWKNFNSAVWNQQTTTTNCLIIPNSNLFICLYLLVAATLMSSRGDEDATGVYDDLSDTDNYFNLLIPEAFPLSLQGPYRESGDLNLLWSMFS